MQNQGYDTKPTRLRGIVVADSCRTPAVDDGTGAALATTRAGGTSTAVAYN